MIDSLNFIIKDVNYVDFNALMKLGIKTIKRYNNTKNNFNKISYTFKYKDIDFKYIKSLKILILITKVPKILKKKDINIKDKEKYIKLINKIVDEILPNMKEKKIEINRIDYCIDINVGKRIEEYINVLKKHKNKFKYMQKKEYDTSIYMKNKSGQIRFNFYDKYKENKNKEYKGVLRLEIQNTPVKIRNQCKRYGILKDIHNYWSIDGINRYYFELIEKYLYRGDYFKREDAKRIINGSIILSKNEKQKLKKFTLQISRYGIDKIVKLKKYSYATVKKYISLLEGIGVNPIILEESAKYGAMKNLVVQVEKKIKEYTFENL